MPKSIESAQRIESEAGPQSRHKSPQKQGTNCRYYLKGFRSDQTENRDPDLGRIRPFRQRALPRKMFDDLGCSFSADEGREFFNTRFRNFVNRTEVAQQPGLALFTNAGNGRQFG